MLKGAQKRMIVVRTRDSRLFEEAYFVMRRDLPDTDAHGSDMLWEANRIIDRSLGASMPRPAAEACTAANGLPRKRVFHNLWVFLCGALAGGSLVCLLSLWW